MHKPTRRQGLRRGLIAGVLVVGFLFVFTLWQALQVRLALSDVAVRMSTVVQQVSVGKTAAAGRSLDSAADSARKADAYTRGPVWWTASKLPWIGDDVTAVRVVSEVGDDLTSRTLPQMLKAGSVFGPAALKPRQGRFDLRPFGRVAPALERGAREMRGYAARVDALPTRGLAWPLRDPVKALQQKFDAASSAADSAAIAARLLPPMMGAGGKRTYLLTFQSPAEIRAQGGHVGALAVFTADRGRVRLTRQATPRDIGIFDPPFVKITRQERALFTERIGVYAWDTVFIPDFARSSGLVKQMWQRRNPETLDGVISIDAVALGYLMRGTGPVRLSNGVTLNASNAAGYLLRQVYLQVPSATARDNIFAEVTRKVFQSIRAGDARAPGLISGLAQAARERRLMMWSSRPDEERQIAPTLIAGLLPTRATRQPQIGVYLNDASADKTSAYLDYRVDIKPQACLSDKVQSLAVKTSLTNALKAPVSLPPGVLGNGVSGRPPGWMRHSVYLYAPVGGRVGDVTIDGRPAATATYTYRGRQVAAITVDLAPGQRRVIDYQVFTDPGQTGKPRLLSTPGANGSGQGRIGAPAC